MIYFILCSCMSIGEVALNAILIPNNCPDNLRCLEMFCQVGLEKKTATDVHVRTCFFGQRINH